MQLFCSRISRHQNQPPTPVLLKCAKLLPNATLLYEATNSLRLVQKQLGHASIGTTQVYADE